MQLVVKLGVTLAVVALAIWLGKRTPTLGGLIATMPLTGVVVMLWLHSEKPEDPQLMIDYTKGALFGIGPSIAFFVAVWMALRYGFPLWMVVPSGLAVWLLAALLHQFALR
jgi:hypothetical protein